jgi:hypothetical protein
MRLPIPRIRRHGNRYMLWPVRLTRASPTRWGWHGWEAGCEPGNGSNRYMPGLRGVYGQVLHFPWFRIVMGVERLATPCDTSSVRWREGE